MEFESGFFLGCIAGGAIALFSVGFFGSAKRGIVSLLSKIRTKLSPEYDEIMKTLSLDTQIILKNYMKPLDYYGARLYVVHNVKKFDMLLRLHAFQELNYHFEKSCDAFYEFAKESVADGSGFIIILNGEEYVAVPPPFGINPDGTIN